MVAAAAVSRLTASVVSSRNRNRPLLRHLEGAATAGKRRIGHEISMGREGVFARVVRVANVCPIWLHVPALGMILHERNHDLPHHLFMDRGIVDGNERLD